MADPTYERPTDELRQVLVTERDHENRGCVMYRCYRLQRKWLVYDDQVAGDYIRVWSDGHSKPPRAVWRDLPIVSEAEAQEEDAS